MIRIMKIAELLQSLADPRVYLRFAFLWRVLMRPSEAYRQHKETIRQIVGRNRATNPRIFGSVLHGEDTEDSDLDLLVDATERTTLFDIVMIERQLREALGVNVDVQTPESLSKRFRSVVLSEAASL